MDSRWRVLWPQPPLAHKTVVNLAIVLVHLFPRFFGLFALLLAFPHTRLVFNEWGPLQPGKLIKITAFYPKLYIKEANHDGDHIHLLATIPPQMTVGSVVRLVKSNTARKIKDKFPVLKKHYWGTDSLGLDGYFVSTVGITTDIIKRSIAKQGELDTGQTAPPFD